MSATTSITPDETKFKELILYIARAHHHVHCGAVKLNKLLFYSECLAFLKFGEPLTGVGFRKLPKGPGPTRMKLFKEQLEAAKDAYVYGNPLGSGNIEKQLYAVREANVSGFTPEQIALVDSVIRDFWNSTGNDLSELSHVHAGWRLAEDGEEIPYYTALIPDPNEDACLSDDEIRWAKGVASRVNAQAL